MSTTEIENILHRAPQPKAPGNLQQRLKAQALSVPRVSATPRAPRPAAPGSWLARWWPALAPTVVSLACAATLSFQQKEFRQLRTELESHGKAQGRPIAIAVNGGPSGDPGAAPASEQNELLRLRSLAASLSAEVAKLEQTQADNARLRAQLASRSAAMFSPEEANALEEARDRAMSIQCVNQLKQLGLAVRIWANDHGELSPPNVLCLSNELSGHFDVLVCPADAGRQPASDPGSFTAANCSYEYLAPSAPETEPQRILFRCPIHGNLGLVDGSVQRAIVKNHPDWIVQRDGKLYMEAPPAPVAEPRNSQSSGSNQN
ncbi:MAG TPA: hypothetical protein VFE51_05025 [Verrucomicrobiae bacterium]|nr:hypothetical protein [Verrucomicrobiae bacterium]